MYSSRVRYNKNQKPKNGNFIRTTFVFHTAITINTKTSTNKNKFGVYCCFVHTHTAAAAVSKQIHNCHRHFPLAFSDKIREEKIEF